jgi:5'-nucleotidase
MGQTAPAKCVIAISSRALFDLRESDAVFQKDGEQAYAAHQIKNEHKVLAKGSAFHLIEKILKLNQHQTSEQPLVEVVLLSRNSADTGLRIFNSIAHYQLQMTRAVFTCGRSPYPYLQAMGAHLFLSLNPDDVRAALAANCAAATLCAQGPEQTHDHSEIDQVRIAFDGDAVLFSDAAERIFQEQGFEQFFSQEQKQANQPLPGGPFKGFLAALHQLQQSVPVCKNKGAPIRIALVTARSVPAHERVIKTLRLWNIRIDEAFFLGGRDKSHYLKAFCADIFFDDQQKHCQKASAHVSAAHVPHGICNEVQHERSDEVSDD